MNNIAGIIVSFIFVAAVMALSTVLTNKGIIKGEGSRKLIHIGVCNWWIIAMVFFNSPLYASLVPGVFVIVNYISYKKNLIKAMERDGSKKDLGTVYYAVSLLVLALITFRQGSEPYIGALGIFVMGYGDGLAAVIGDKLGKRKMGPKGSGKSVEGTLTMFIASLLVCLIITGFNKVSGFAAISLLLAAYATVAELYTPHGFDNLTVPLGTSFLYMIIHTLL